MAASGVSESGIEVKPVARRASPFGKRFPKIRVSTFAVSLHQRTDRSSSIASTIRAAIWIRFSDAGG